MGLGGEGARIGSRNGRNNCQGSKGKVEQNGDIVRVQGRYIESTRVIYRKKQTVNYREQTDFGDEGIIDDAYLAYLQVCCYPGRCSCYQKGTSPSRWTRWSMSGGKDKRSV